jgi:hypothetical protein
MNATKREKRNKDCRRPHKHPRAQRQRLKVQKLRLIALGMPEAKVEKLDQKVIREFLKRPERTRKQLAAQA